jgi:tRNA1(Val) A37 N6-methylase TrmN6
MTTVERTDKMIGLLKKKLQNARTPQEIKQCEDDLNEIQSEMKKRRGKTKMMCRLPLNAQLWFMHRGITPYD